MGTLNVVRAHMCFQPWFIFVSLSRKMKVIDGEFEVAVAQYQLIINSVLCCRGVTGLLESDLCFLADHTHTQVYSLLSLKCSIAVLLLTSSFAPFCF